MKKCEYCTKEHDGSYASGRFCNNKCARAFSTKAKRIEINRQVSKKLIKHGKYTNLNTGNCLYCGKDIKLKRQNLYCSAECMNLYHYYYDLNRWLLNLDDVCISKSGCVPAVARRYLFDKYNNSCQKCSWSEFNPTTGSIPLHIHHINGDITNNRLDNLELLCPNCHSLTDNYGPLNKNGKLRRRKPKKK